MKRHFNSSISAVAVSAMVLSSAVATISINVSPAFSKSDNANGGNSNNSNSNGGNRDNSNSNGGNRDNSGRSDNSYGRGSEASSLGALNAAHANANALASASTNSRVGMIQIYKLAVEITAAAVDAFDVATLALKTFEDNCTGTAPNMSAEECAALEDTAPEGFTYVQWLEQAVADADTAISGAKETEADALLAAANKSTDEEIIQALWGLLDIDGYVWPSEP